MIIMVIQQGMGNRAEKGNVPSEGYTEASIVFMLSFLRWVVDKQGCSFVVYFLLFMTLICQK